MDRLNRNMSCLSIPSDVSEDLQSCSQSSGSSDSSSRSIVFKRSNSDSSAVLQPAYYSKYKNEFIETGKREEGGFGCVEQVINKTDKMPYAIKRIPLKSSSVEDEKSQCLIQEAKFLASPRPDPRPWRGAAWRGDLTGPLLLSSETLSGSFSSRRRFAKHASPDRSTMKLALVVAALCAAVAPAWAANKVVCYYDSRAYWREGAAKIEPVDLEPSLSLCTHLIYGYAVVDGNTNRLTPMDDYVDLDTNKGYYRLITSLKARHPGLRVLLSVGGGADSAGEKDKYLTLLETPEKRLEFVNSAKQLLKHHNFDGLDLAWQFPVLKEKKERGTLGSVWHKIKKTFSSGSKDEKEEEHRDGFTSLVRELKAALRGDGLMLTAAVIPHVNSTVYYDYRVLAPLLDQIHLMTYDFRTPERSPQEADYPAPLYYVHDRKSYQNVDATVRRWLEHGTDAVKIIVGIPTFGRSWKLNAESGISGVPPVVADGPGDAGTVTKTPGIMAWQETCLLLHNSKVADVPNDRLLRRVGDPSKRLGSYAYRLPKKSDETGMWVGYEDVESAGYKAAWVKNRGLGGIAIYDLSMDDPRGVCDGNKFPILRAAKNGL